MKNLTTSLVGLLSITSAFGQLSLPYSTNFDSGIPSSWTQNSSMGVAWSGHPNAGVGGSGCAVSNNNDPGNNNTVKGWLQTPHLDLTSVSNPVLTFDIASTYDSYHFGKPPSISLWYAVGNGNWVYMENWGDTIWWPNASHEISLGYDTVPNSYYVEHVTIDLGSFSSQSNIRFAFGADYPYYGDGWATLDNVEFSGITGIHALASNDLIAVFPNPASGSIHINTNEPVNQYFITDQLGRVVLEGKPLNNVIDISSLENNCYSLSFIRNKDQALLTSRFIKL